MMIEEKTFPPKGLIRTLAAVLRVLPIIGAYQMKKRFLGVASKALLAWLLVAAFAAGTQAAEERPPNIVFLFADDLGYGDLGCYGHPYARTLAIDQLSKEGTRFTQFYVTGVTCNPSRTGLMTGLFPARFPKYAPTSGSETA